jgi:hypothetical protein
VIAPAYKPSIVYHIERATDTAAQDILLMRLDEALTAKTGEQYQKALDKARNNMEALATAKGLFIQHLQGVEL